MYGVRGGDTNRRQVKGISELAEQNTGLWWSQRDRKGETQMT